MNNLQLISQQASQYLEAAERAVIDSNESMERGADMAKMLKSVAKKVEEARVAAVKPLNDKVSDINAEHKAIINPLTSAAKSVEAKMLAFTKEQQRIAEEEAAERQRQLEEERTLSMEMALISDEDGHVYEEIIIPEIADVTAIAVPTLVRSNRGSVAGIRKVWTYEVVDIVALANARPDLVEAISSKINSEIKGEEGNRDIPGLRIYQQESMSVR